ncbi:hypothetical protein ABID70_000328 [Clavibacter michiganensis]
MPSCSVEPITVPRASATGPCGYAPSGVVATGVGAESPPRIEATSYASRRPPAVTTSRSGDPTRNVSISSVPRSPVVARVTSLVRMAAVRARPLRVSSTVTCCAVDPSMSDPTATKRCPGSSAIQPARVHAPATAGIGVADAMRGTPAEVMSTTSSRGPDSSTKATRPCPIWITPACVPSTAPGTVPVMRPVAASATETACADGSATSSQRARGAASAAGTGAAREPARRPAAARPTARREGMRMVPAF